MRDKTKLKDRCEEIVTCTGGWHRRQCNNKGKVVVEGKTYCGVHNPIRLAKKREEKEAEWDLKRERMNEQADRRQVMYAYFEGVSTEEIKNLLRQKRG